MNLHVPHFMNEVSYSDICSRIICSNYRTEKITLTSGSDNSMKCLNLRKSSIIVSDVFLTASLVPT